MHRGARYRPCLARWPCAHGPGVRDARGAVLAGARRPDGTFAGNAALDAVVPRPAPASFASASASASALALGDPAARVPITPSPLTNTTLCVIAASRRLDRVALAPLARAASAALYRRITPCGTTFDGDVMFALCPDDPLPS